MPSFNFSTDISQGFNFQKDSQARVGHLVSLKISDSSEFASDIHVEDPNLIAGDKIPVFGVISDISWDGGYTDPICVTAQISNANKKQVTLLTHMSMENTSLEVAFDIFEFDPEARKYFKAFHTNDQTIKGLLIKQGEELQLFVDDEANYEIQSPKNYTLRFCFMHDEKEPAQDMHVAVSETHKFVKPFGLTVSS